MENVLQTGLDRSLPHIGVIMQKFDTGRYPKFTLPGGFSFCSFRPGLEEQWARLQHQVGGIDSLQEARTIFYQEFLLGKGYNWLGETPPAPRIPTRLLSPVMNRCANGWCLLPIRKANWRAQLPFGKERSSAGRFSASTG